MKRTTYHCDLCGGGVAARAMAFARKRVGDIDVCETNHQGDIHLCGPCVAAIAAYENDRAQAERKREGHGVEVTDA